MSAPDLFHFDRELVVECLDGDGVGYSNADNDVLCVSIEMKLRTKNGLNIHDESYRRLFHKGRSPAGLQSGFATRLCCKDIRSDIICRMKNPFKWRHYQPEIILTSVRWYLRYALSYRDLEEMISERGLSVDHTTIYRWVQKYAPEIDKRSRPHLKQTNDSWRVDETYVKVKGRWMYLYRAVDSTGKTLDFLLNQTRSTRAAKRFFRKVLGRSNVSEPRVINVDKNRCYIGAVKDLKADKLLPKHCKRRASKYMNNLIEQDHRFIKRRVSPGLGFSSFQTAWQTLQGYEAINMIRKGQIVGAEKGNIKAQNRFISSLLGLTA